MDFPRGGSFKKSETKSTYFLGDQDLYQSTNDVSKLKEKRKSEKSLDLVKSKKSKIHSEISHARLLKYKNLKELGMNCLGVIKEINDLEIVFSLPHQLIGSASIAEISNSFSIMINKVAGIQEKGSESEAMSEYEKEIDSEIESDDDQVNS